MSVSLESLENTEFAIFYINNKKVAIQLSYLERFNLITEIIKIPRAPKFVLGVIRIEKAIIPLIDLEILLGKKKTEKKNAVALVIALKDNVFALYSNTVPIVQRVEDLEKDSNYNLENIPKEWVSAYINEDEAIPIIDPNAFWIGLGDNSILGPSLQYNLYEEDEDEEEVEDESEEDEEEVESEDEEDEVEDESEDEEDEVEVESEDEEEEVEVEVESEDEEDEVEDESEDEEDEEEDESEDEEDVDDESEEEEVDDEDEEDEEDKDDES
ncbi:MAG: chemotaxis protein CheW [Candidatus Heimdallarchaeota archaeon]|nr:chemotaxis protein CheW [Candidatus Heimdallarchaeota archaeon]